MDEELEILPWSAVPDLLKVYEQDGMEYYATYIILRIYYDWNNLYPEVGTLFLCPGGKVDKYGTFFLIIRENCTVLFDSLYADPMRLLPLSEKCFKTFIKWTGSIIFGPIEKRFWPVLDRIITNFNLERLGHSYATGYYMPKEQAKTLSVNCPDNVYVGPVKEENSALINSCWPHRYDGSINLVKSVIRRNGGVGVFLKENNELVAWALHGHYNGPQFLQTVESHMRKGYGYIAAAAISQYVANKGLHPILYVVENNTASETLFNKLGYKKFREVQWNAVSNK